MKYKLQAIFLLIICFFNFRCTENVSAQSVTWIYPWENTISKLQFVKNPEVIPIPLNGFEDRILKITNVTSNNLNLLNYSISAEGVGIEVYHLPVIRNFSNNPILDVMLPFPDQAVQINKGETAYFLFKFKGLNSGKHNVKFTFKEKNGTSISAATTIFVGSNLNSVRLNLNVWADFDYPLIKGLQNQVVNDLVAHHANVLIIPPKYLPAITSTTIAKDAPELKGFLKGLVGKFDYYLVYRNYKNYDDNFVLSDKWKRNFSQWHLLVKQSLVNAGIDYSKVYFYPYDEPNKKQALNLIKMINWSKQNNVDAKYYVTINNASTVNLANYADLVQIYNNPQLLKKFGELQGHKAKLWIYDIISESRNRSPLKFLKYAWTAYKFGSTGIGTWNYADVKRAYTQQSLQSINLSSKRSLGLTGSWSLKPQNFQRDYSLIYREGDSIVSSLRWEALKQCIQEFKYLELYQKTYGKQKTISLVNQLLSGDISPVTWNNMKLTIIGGN